MVYEFWKSKLNDKNKKLYEHLLLEFKNEKQKVVCNNYSMENVLKTYEALYNDHAELFYLSHEAVVNATISVINTTSVIEVKFIYSSNEIEYFKKTIGEIVGKLRPVLANKSDLVKEKLICDYIIENTNYAIDDKYNQNAGNVLVKHVGQCSGISKACKLLFDFFGLKSFIVCGKLGNSTDDNHAWNMIILNDKYYHLDVTQMLSLNSSKKKPFIYMYNNYSDEQMEIDHTWDRSIIPSSNKNNEVSNVVKISSMMELWKLLRKQNLNNNVSINFICDIDGISNEKLLNKIMFTTKMFLYTRLITRKISVNIMSSRVLLDITK